MDAYRCFHLLSCSAFIFHAISLTLPAFSSASYRPSPSPLPPSSVPSGEFHDNVKEGSFSQRTASCPWMCPSQATLTRAIAGFGSMRFYNGDNYQGEWLNDRRHGQGKQQ